MAFAVSSGRPDYTGNFIPEIWSGKLIENFYDATVLAAISTLTTKVKFEAWVTRLISVPLRKSPSNLMSKGRLCSRKP